jgi:hypothetical protein
MNFLSPGEIAICHSPSVIAPMSDSPDPELLRSLGRLVRGLSALFWGLPLSLLVCVQAAKMDWRWPLAVSAPLVATGLLIFGLVEIGSFRKHERPWRKALDIAKVLALINCGLSPFLYWWNRMPENIFFTLILGVMALCGVLFVLSLNVVLLRLGEMLPDEALRQETRQFTLLNRGLLLFVLFVAAAYVGLMQVREVPIGFERIFFIAERLGPWLPLFLSLPPLATTMALIWKAKEVVMDGVFGQK